MSLVVANVSTMLNDVILCAITLEMCYSGTLHSISNVKVGEKIFGEVMKVFSLQAQQWGAILASFLGCHIFLPLPEFLMFHSGHALRVLHQVLNIWIWSGS